MTFIYYNTNINMFKIFNNSKIESGGMMSKDKIIINLTIEEWNTFQQLL